SRIAHGVAADLARPEARAGTESDAAVIGDAEERHVGVDLREILAHRRAEKGRQSHARQVGAVALLVHHASPAIASATALWDRHVARFRRVIIRSSGQLMEVSCYSRLWVQLNNLDGLSSALPRVLACPAIILAPPFPRFAAMLLAQPDGRQWRATGSQPATGIDVRCPGDLDMRWNWRAQQ